MSDPLNIDAIYDQIKAVLESHRMSFTHEDEDSTLPLVDMLCAPGAKDVETGKEEIIAICDAIYSEVLQPLATLSHPATQAGALQAVSDEQIIKRCAASGIKWIAPDLENDPPSEGGFPGSFDMVTLAEMRSLLANGAWTEQASKCEDCGGSGVDGDVDDYGRTIDIECGACYGTGRVSKGWKAAINRVERVFQKSVIGIVPADYATGYTEALEHVRRALAATQPSAAPGDGHVWLKCDGCGKDMRSHDRMGHCAAPGDGQVVWVLKFPGDGGRLCLSTVFDTEEEAKEYASRCQPVEIVRLAAPSTATAAREQGMVRANLYLQLADAMGYDSGKDGMEFSPEEWAAALLKDALSHRAALASHLEAPAALGAEGQGKDSVIAAALDHADKMGCYSFVLPVPCTTPPLFIAFGDIESCLSLLECHKDQAANDGSGT